jgi:hypothetical protein
MVEESIQVGDTVINRFHHSVEDYLDLTTIILGGTGTGKSTIIRDVIHACKDYIPLYYVLCNPSSSYMYEKLEIPKKAIKRDITAAKWDQILKRQETVTHYYSMVRDPDLLCRLCSKVDPSISGKIGSIKAFVKNWIKEHENSISEEEEQELKNKMINRIAEICHKLIDDRKPEFKKIFNSLDQDEQSVILNYRMNPKIMIIIDDRTELIKTWIKDCGKLESNPIDTIFFAGRHNHISLVVATHSETCLPVRYRMNIRVVFYTASAFLTGAAKRPNFSGTDKDREIARGLSKKVFENNEAMGDPDKKYRKVCYMQNAPVGEKWRFFTAKTHHSFKTGCDSMRVLSDNLPDQSAKYLDSNLAKRLSGRPTRKTGTSKSIPKVRKGARKY